MARFQEINLSKLGPEAISQITFFHWIRAQPKLAPFCFSVPNERKTSPMHGALLKKMGLKPGVADIFIAIPSGEYHGLWVEMKAGKNKPTPLQLEFLANMKSKGYATAICYDAPTAIKTLEDYLYK